ncbi:hypothetical protein M758_UG169600 [Ceratodon purpureus]|nr:hypothetical protein M758_UG169600 [Ceratodon purpureus]
MNDTADPAWKVVLRHDPSSKRIGGDRECIVFGATGSARPTLSTRSGLTHNSQADEQAASQDGYEELPLEMIAAIVREEEHIDDETHLDDNQFEDEVEIQYVE